jgi:hypothetical protein
VKAQQQQEKCNLVIIPGGMTEILQPLQVLINWPFKVYIQHSFSEWAQKTNKMMLTSCIKKVTLTEMYWWILKA